MTDAILENIIHKMEFTPFYESLELYKTQQYDKALEKIKTQEISEDKYPIFYFFCAKIFEGLLDYENTKKSYELYLSSTVNPLKDIVNDYHNYKISIMKKWIEQNGGKIKNIKIEYYDVDYRGMCTTENINKNKVLMEIPLKCIISTLEIKKTSWGKKLTSLPNTNDEEINPHVFLAIELLNIKYSQDHFQKPIVECLPQYFDNVPINFSDEEKSELKGSYALVKIKEKIESLTKSYELVKKILNFSYTLEDYIWARTSIITRIYGVVRTSNAKDTIMVPFADMANHRIPANTKWFFDNNTDCFIVKANEYIEKGDNIYESYGTKSNYRYFVNYGFTIDNNPTEQVCIKLKRHLYHVGYAIDDEFKEMMGELWDEYDSNRIASYVYFIQYCESRLTEFSTTLEEDIKILNSKEKISFNYRNCIVQRKGEKKLFRFYISCFNLLLTYHIKKKAEQPKIIKQIKKLCTNEKAFQFAEGIKFLL